MPLPYLTRDLPGIAGLMKQHPDDFIVDEVPLYAPEGVGTHGYAYIEKRNLSTLEAVRLIAKSLGKLSHDIGYAGLKDTKAVTRQWISAEHVESDRLRKLEVPHVKVLEITRHRNKIKVGHLKGNRFQIKIRNPEWSRAGASLNEPRQRAEAIWAVLSQTGMPNFFGPQRFGMRKNNHLLGMALLSGDLQKFVDLFLGDPDPSVDHGDVLLARQHYAKGRVELAAQHWPGHMQNERRSLQMLASKKPLNRAVGVVDLKLRQLLTSALQSFLFNEVLAQRLDRMAEILPGDLCWKHENGAAFAVGPTKEDAAQEQPRADAHEISPTGPMFGHKMTDPEGEPLAMEQAVLESHKLTPKSFTGPAGSHGARRQVRVFPENLRIETGEDQKGPFLQLAFMLPSGAYATVLLAEIMKTDINVD